MKMQEKKYTKALIQKKCSKIMSGQTPQESYICALRGMLYGQFACQYRKLDPSQIGYEKSYEECYKSETKVGPDSDFHLVGVQDKAAPSSMLLKNGVVMKLREKGTAVPILPSDEKVDVTDMLLFGEWKTSEKVVEAEDTPLKIKQRQTARLELFPKMAYE